MVHLRQVHKPTISNVMSASVVESIRCSQRDGWPGAAASTGTDPRAYWVLGSQWVYRARQGQRPEPRFLKGRRGQEQARAGGVPGA
jgi:hypothetical protein